MKIDFVISDTWDRWVPVAGVIVDVAPHLPGTYAVHRDVFKPNRWRVSHVETGAGVSDFTYSTRAMAIHKATIALRDKTEADLAKAVERLPKWART
jgi:hypothetical protein